MEHELRYSKEAIAAELERAGCTSIKGKTVRCPFCNDKTPSGWLKQSSDGVWRYKCHKNESCPSGDVFDLRTHIDGKPLNKTIKENAPENPPETRRKPEKKKLKVYASIDEIIRFINTMGRFEIKHEYTNPDTGKLDLVIFRWYPNNAPEKKSIYQARPVPGGLELTAPKPPLPLFNRTRLRDADTVLVVEGEKCVLAAHEFGIVATTSPGGFQQPQNADWSPLAGKKVVIWRDNDEAGKKYQDKVIELLQDLNPQPEVSVIHVEYLDLPEKGDIYDYIERDRGRNVPDHAIKDLLLDTMNDAEALSPSGALLGFYEDIITGRRNVLAWSHPVLTNVPRALRGGGVIIVCGDPSSSKTLFVHAELLDWHLADVKVAALFLEENKEYYDQRTHVLLSGESRLFDPIWIRNNAVWVRMTLNDISPQLDSFSKRIWCTNDASTTPDMVIEWVRARAEEGCRVVAIDPVPAIEYSSRPWEDDKRLIKQTKAIAAAHDMSLIYVTHPRPGRKHSFDLEHLAGGQAFPRFATTVLWLESHKQESRTSMVVRGDIEVECIHNRTVHLAKTRDGPGHGSGIAYHFDSKTCRFQEFGLILPKQKSKPKLEENNHVPYNEAAERRAETRHEDQQATFPGDAGYPETRRFD